MKRRGPIETKPRFRIPAVGTEDEDWRISALCRDHPNPDPIWNPHAPENAELGKQICQDCPVKQRCAEYAMTRREPHGTWGGITEWERHFLLTGRIRTKRRK